MYHRLKFAALGLVFGLAVLGTSYMTTSQQQAFGASALNVFQGGTGTTSPSGILYGDNGATPRLSTVTMGANCTFSAGVLNCAGGSGGTGAATSSFAATWPIVLTPTASSITYSFDGIASSSPWTNGQLAMVVSGNRLSGVSTSTLTPSSPLTGSFVQVGSGGTLGIQAASASQAGSMSAGDYQRLYTATTTFSSPLVYTNGTNAVTCPTCSTIANPFTFASTFGTTSAATTTSIWTQGVFFASSSATSTFDGSIRVRQNLTVATSVSPTTTNGPFSTGVGFGNVLFSCESCGGNGSNLLGIANYGTGVGVGINTFSARGTTASPSATQASDVLYFMGGRGYGSTGWNVGSKAAIQYVASQAHTDANNGTYITLETTANNTITRVERVRIDQSGFVGIATTTPGTMLSVSGNGVISGNLSAARYSATSTLAASIFPYASTTAVTATTASSTNLILSSAGGTGTRCVQVGTDGTLSASASACAAGFSWPFTSINTFGTTSIATSTSITTQGAFYASSTVARSNFAGNFTLGTGDLRSGAMFQMTSSSPSYLQYVLRNSQINPQATSSVDLVFENASSTNTTYFANIGFNSPTYTDRTFTICTSHCTYHYASDGALALGSATTSSTGIIQFFTGGTLAANEKARFTNGGNFGIATTTPWGLLSVNPSGITGPAFTVGSSSATYFLINNGGKVGVASSTPWGLLSINTNACGTTPAFAVGSSTQTIFGINCSGGLLLSASQPATSTSIVLNWADTPPQIEYRIGFSATTITIINATTSMQWGSRKLVWVCNPGGTAGALTWAGVEWVGTAPTQTTTADQCDTYSFDVTRATSTTAYKVAGTAGTGFK